MQVRTDSWLDELTNKLDDCSKEHGKCKKCRVVKTCRTLYDQCCETIYFSGYADYNKCRTELEEFINNENRFN